MCSEGHAAPRCLQLTSQICCNSPYIYAATHSRCALRDCESWSQDHRHRVSCSTYIYIYTYVPQLALDMWFQDPLCVVGSSNLYVSFAKEPYKRDYTLQKRPMILRSLLIEEWISKHVILRSALTVVQHNSAFITQTMQQLSSCICCNIPNPPAATHSTYGLQLTLHMCSPGPLSQSRSTTLPARWPASRRQVRQMLHKISINI